MVDVDGVQIRTASLEGLLLTKRTMREKDRADCAVIERALAVLLEREMQDASLGGMATPSRN